MNYIDSFLIVKDKADDVNFQREATLGNTLVLLNVV